MRLTVRELAARVDGRIVGNGAVEITGFSGIDHAGPGDLTFVGHEKYAGLAPTTRAAAVVVAREIAGCPAVQIVVRDASVAFAVVMAGVWRDRLRGPGGRHASAVVDATARIADDVALGACAVVEARASIGPRSVIGAGTFIGAEVIIGADCLIHPNVTILHGSRVHDRVIIHSGAVLGADGFGYATDHAGHHHKIPQTGIVVVEDDVEIGANTTVDRARFRETRIGRGTKIDNLVQIAHNVVIGQDAIIVAQTGIAGSTEIEDRVVLGAMVGVGGHLRVGAGAQVAAMSGVNRSLEANQAYIGAPLMTYREGMRSRVIQRRLPELDKSLKDALARIAALEALIARLPGAGESP